MLQNLVKCKKIKILRHAKPYKIINQKYWNKTRNVKIIQWVNIGPHVVQYKGKAKAGKQWKPSKQK